MRHLIRFFKWTMVGLGAALAGLLTWCLIPIEPTISAIRPRPDTRYWAMSGGYRIAYTHLPAAAPGKTPIIFLHGGPGGYVHSSSIALLGGLTSLGHDVYLYDQVGSGLSDRLKRPKDYSFQGHVADLSEIIRLQIRAERAILIGHSYGGQLAAQLTAQEPALVDRLILSSPGGLQPALWENGRWVNEDLYPRPDSLHFVTVDRVPMDGLKFWTLRGVATMGVAMLFNCKLMSDAEADGLLNTLASRFTVNGVCDSTHVLPEEGGAGWYAHGGGNWYGDLEDPRPLIRQCNTPVLVLQGSCDYIPYESTYEYVDLFRNSRYVHMEGAGHLIWWDRPDDYLAVITAFLAEDASP